MKKRKRGACLSSFPVYTRWYVYQQTFFFQNFPPKNFWIRARYWSAKFSYSFRRGKNSIDGKLMIKLTVKSFKKPGVCVGFFSRKLVELWNACVCKSGYFTDSVIIYKFSWEKPTHTPVFFQPLIILSLSLIWSSII